jgi:predicted transglutaminase-like cysteine proteinase
MCRPACVVRFAQAIAVAIVALYGSQTAAYPLPSAISQTKSAVSEPFGALALTADEGELSRKWRAVQQQIMIEAQILTLCRGGPATCQSGAPARFLAIVAAGQVRPGRARLGEINRAINLAIRYMSDIAQHGVADRWNSPLLSLAAGVGDCEDYAIAKYVALREAGTAREDVRLLIVHDNRFHQDHAVVAARLDGHWLLLDNRHMVMVEDVDARQYQPLFEIDDEGVRTLIVPTPGPGKGFWQNAPGLVLADSHSLAASRSSLE